MIFPAAPARPKNSRLSPISKPEAWLTDQAEYFCAPVTVTVSILKKMDSPIPMAMTTAKIVSKCSVKRRRLKGLGWE